MKKAYQILRAKAAEKARLKKASSDTRSDTRPLAHVLQSPPQPPTLPTPPTHASLPHSLSSTSTTAPVETSGEPHPPAQVAIEPQAGPSGEPHPPPQLHTPIPPPQLREDICKLPDPEHSGERRYFITESQLQAIVERLQCPKEECNGNLKIIPSTHGWDIQLDVMCLSCDENISHIPPKKCLNSSKMMETTVMETKHSLDTGVGRAGMIKRAAMMGLPHVTPGAYSRHSHFIFSQVSDKYQESITHAHQAILEHYVTRNICHPDDSNILNIAVGCDGTWMTRGHKSHVGAAFIIEAYTGIVVDFEVLCNYCPTCRLNKPHKCHKNFEGKSGAMEKEAAVRLWSRSTNFNFRYTTFIGDGDSSAYDAVCQMNDKRGPYDNVAIVKEECVNHVNKRMGTRLRKMRNDVATFKQNKSGKWVKKSSLGGINMLTETVIGKLTHYYGQAIRDSVGTDVTTARQKIWSSFFHLTSTDASPAHHFCPKGPESWCFYNKAVATNTKPVPHEAKKLYLAKIPYEKLQYIKQVYRDLSDTHLLQRCLMGRTQNPNESLHSKLWQKCQKIKFAGYYRVNYACQVTTLEHNFGYLHGDSTRLWFGSHDTMDKMLDIRDKERRRSQSKTPRKRRKTEPVSKEYQPGAF